MTFVKATEFYVNNSWPGEVMPVFVNTYTGVGGGPNIWHTVDMSPWVPEDTKAIHLTGMLIITHGSTAEIADMVLHLRTDQTVSTVPTWQVIETSTSGGQRSTMATWVGLDSQRQFQYMYTMKNPGTMWPTYSAYGINLRMDAYVK